MGLVQWNLEKLSENENGTKSGWPASTSRLSLFLSKKPDTPFGQAIVSFAADPDASLEFVLVFLEEVRVHLHFRQLNPLLRYNRHHIQIVNFSAR